MLDPRTALSPEAAPFTPTPMSYTSESARAAAGAQYHMPSPGNFGNPYSGQYREYSTRSPYPGQYTEYSTRSPASPALRGSPVRRVSPQVAASLKIPSPTKEYLVLSNEPLRTNSLAKPLLLIIDLNGTLLHRPRRQARPQDFNERPFTKSFLKYALSNHVVMIWSSARPENVSAMCRKLFPQGDGAGIIAQWSRDHLGLTSMEYHSKVQVYKRLEKVWADARIQATYPEADVTFDPFGEGRWNQTNTVLIDDTAEKAKGQPFNLIQIPEFVGKKLEDDTVLPVLIDYLQSMKYQANVSAYMRKEPFNYQKLKAVYSAPDYPSYDEQSTEGEGAGTVRDVKFTAFSAGDEKVIGKGKGKEGEVLIRDIKGGGQNLHPVSWAAVNRMDVEFTTSGKGAGTVRDSGFDISSVLDKKALDMAKAKAEQEFIQSIYMGLNKDEISLSRTYNWTAVNSSVANPVPKTTNKADVQFSISSEIVREVEFTTSSVGNEKAIDKGKGKEEAGVEFTTSVDTDMDRDNGETLLPRMYNGLPAYGSLPNPVPATTYNADTQSSTSSAPMPQGPLEPGATQDNPMPISSDVSFSDDDSEDDEDGGVPLPPYDDYAQGYAHGIGKNGGGGGGGGGARGDNAGGY